MLEASPSAWRMVWFGRLAAAACPTAAPVLRMASMVASGMTGSRVKAKTTSACCQPSVSIRMLPIGGKRNWPKEPAAVPAPKAAGASSPAGACRSREDQVEGAGREAEADQHASAKMQLERRRGIGHHDEAGGIEQRADAEHPDEAETVGDGAGEGCAAPRAGSGSPAPGRRCRGPSRVASSGSEEAGAGARPEADRAIRQPATTMISGAWLRLAAEFMEGSGEWDRVSAR